MSDLEICTTEGRRKRHLSDNLQPDRHAPREPGRGGTTLCGQYAKDEERANAPQKVWGFSGYEFVPRKRQIRVADLPACLLCERSRMARSGAPESAA